MFSVQKQYGYIVVQMLMTHLDENAKKDATVSFVTKFKLYLLTITYLLLLNRPLIF